MRLLILSLAAAIGASHVAAQDPVTGITWSVPERLHLYRHIEARAALAFQHPESIAVDTAELRLARTMLGRDPMAVPDLPVLAIVVCARRQCPAFSDVVVFQALPEGRWITLFQGGGVWRPRFFVRSPFRTRGDEAHDLNHRLVTGLPLPAEEQLEWRRQYRRRDGLGVAILGDAPPSQLAAILTRIEPIRP